ncbi:MAG: ATP-binding protein [Myxococcales bacterium]
MSETTPEHQPTSWSAPAEGEATGFSVASFLRKGKAAIVRAWETRVTSEQRGVELAGPAMRNEVPELLDELAEWLDTAAVPETSPLGARALSHVLQRLDEGLTLTQVLREYRLLRETIIKVVLWAERDELARTGGSADEARIARIEELARLNAGLDVVFSRSVDEFVKERDRRAASERTLAEEGLAQSEQRYRTLFTSMCEAFTEGELVEDGPAGPDFLFLRVNPAFERQLSVRASDVVGRTAREVFGTVELIWMERYAQVVSTGTPAHFEEYFEALNRWYQVSAYPTGGKRLAVVAFDVTDRVTAQAALQESERRFRSLFDNGMDAIFLTSADGRIQAANAAACTMFGMTEGEILDAARQGLMDPADRPSLDAALDERLRSGRVRAELRFRRKDGSVFTADVESVVLGSERATAFVIARDITGRKHDEQALRQLAQQLEEADRRKTHFLAVLSHELRNPLAPVKNSLYILQRATPGGDQARRAQEVIHRQVDQLAHLVDDLLDVTRIARGKIHLQRRSVELDELVRGTFEDHRGLFERAGIAVSVRSSSGPIFVHADWSRLAQIVGNLLQNAAKFTPKGGCVAVAVSSDEASQQALITVTDNGAGMTPRVLARLFEPFMQADETLDRTQGGLGLGLALVKGLVEQHGGSIEASSEGAGRGAEFTVRLPFQKAAGAAARGTSLAGQEAHRRILVIEDNVDAADSLKEMLELNGHEVAVAYTGPEGVAKAREARPGRRPVRPRLARHGRLCGGARVAPGRRAPGHAPGGVERLCAARRRAARPGGGVRPAPRQAPQLREARERPCWPPGALASWGVERIRNDRASPLPVERAGRVKEPLHSWGV